MGVESMEFVAMRDGYYLRAALEAQEQDRSVPEPRPEVDDRTTGRCVCCGERKPIRPMMHVCDECHEWEAA